MRYIALVLLGAQLAFPQLPEFYKTVSRMTWVVKDLDSALGAWSKLGLSGVEVQDTSGIRATFRGKPASGGIRWATGSLGDVMIDFIQPSRPGNAYSDFLDRRGEGVMALMHEVPDLDGFNRELGRLQALGVQVLQRGKVETGAAPVEFAYLDTEAGGKYSLALLYMAGNRPALAAPRIKVNQFAFVVKDLPAVSAFWQRLGFPEITVTRPKIHDVRYRGKPVSFDQELGWMRHGRVAYEFCPPPVGLDTVYSEFRNKHCEGVQHLGVPVADFDRSVEDMKSLGHVVSLSGAWGEPGKPGWGRYAYIDTPHGLSLELLWSQR
jgi:catechol 2,3-dioxygenase-like lactoylglutathione lyase family enzyme